MSRNRIFLFLHTFCQNLLIKQVVRTKIQQVICKIFLYLFNCGFYSVQAHKPFYEPELNFSVKTANMESSILLSDSVINFLSHTIFWTKFEIAQSTSGSFTQSITIKSRHTQIGSGSPLEKLKPVQ